jgi:hypothetical protein
MAVPENAAYRTRLPFDPLLGHDIGGEALFVYAIGAWRTIVAT